MTAARSYHQFCPVATALDAVGDRWALLVVRELLLGPRRFHQLAEGLPGISTDILTARLRAMESAGVVRRTGGARHGYELTGTGHALRPALGELARWGASRVALPDSIDAVPPRLALTTLLLLPTEAPANVAGCFEVRAGDEMARIVIRDGTTTVLREEDAGHPDAAIELTHADLVSLLLGGRTRDKLRSGDLRIRGDRRAARLLLDGLAAASPLRDRA